MLCLAAWGAVKEVGDDGYTSTTVSKTFASTRNEAALESCFDLLGPAWLNLPKHLKDLKYQNPTDPKDTALAKANKVTGVTPMEIFFSGPHLNAFGLHMGAFTMGHKQWVEIYPVESRMIEGFEDVKDSVMMVDVGDGFCHQAKLLKDAFPKIPGKLIVQDLPQMKGEDIPGIEFQAHDFYLEQPV
jgi:demethylsterigmatocystin 6-O-methyltransferase